jgi:hypothetical protein
MFNQSPITLIGKAGNRGSFSTNYSNANSSLEELGSFSFSDY